MIELAQLAALRAALKLEIIGMKRSRSPSAFSILKTMGYRGNRAAVLEQVSKYLEDEDMIQRFTLACQGRYKSKA